MKKIELSLLVVLLCMGGAVQAQNLDLRLLESINPRSPGSDFWKGTSGSAFFVPAVVSLGPLAYGILHKDKNARINGYEMLGSIAISTVISEALKISIDRERPGEKYPGEVFPAGQEHGRSFPSGHTTLAFATATTLALEYKKWYIVVPSYIWAFSVGYSRLYLGEHYPSDVLGGMAVGIGSGFLTHYIRSRLFNGKKK